MLSIFQKYRYINVYIDVSPNTIRVVLIPKPGRESSLAKSYRPIRLSFFMLKTLKRLMNRFLRGEGNGTRHPLQEFQHAYRGRKSTETARYSLVTKIECSMQEKHSLPWLYLWIYKRHMILPHLRQYRKPGKAEM